MDPRPLDDVIGDLREAIWHDVAGAFVPGADIASRAVDYVAGEAPEAALAELAQGITREALARRWAIATRD